jgi:cytoskeletal protein RodZ
VPVGPQVVAARQASGLTRQQVAAATRVRETLVERIEVDDFSLCGGDIYARGHLRAIGHALDVDPEPWIAEYDREHAWQSVPTPVDVLEHHEVLAARRGPNWTAAMAVALVGVLAVGIWSVLRPDGASSEDPTPPVAGDVVDPGSASSSPEASDSSEPVQPTTPTVDPNEDAVAAVDGVTMTLEAPDGTSWVSVTASDGEVLFQGLLDEGQSRSFDDDDELALVVGNGAAVSLTVNGRDLGAPGGQGEVVRLSFGPGDPSAG